MRAKPLKTPDLILSPSKDEAKISCFFSGLLEFIARNEGGFFFEGDVSEIYVLVDAGDRFVRRCAELIAEVASMIQAQDGIWL
jgi:hypothetical protein